MPKSAIANEPHLQMLPLVSPRRPVVLPQLVGGRVVRRLPLCEEEKEARPGRPHRVAGGVEDVAAGSVGEDLKALRHHPLVPDRLNDRGVHAVGNLVR